MPVILPYKGIIPRIDESAYVANTAAVMGDVTIGAESSVWFGCVLRGDVNKITIGARSNIQDGTVIHVSSFGYATIVGDDVTVGHMALLHACTIGDGAFIGMQACVMDGAVVESGAMVAAGALVLPGKIVSTGQLWGGRPAKFMRDLTDDDRGHIKWSSENYVRLAREYRQVP